MAENRGGRRTPTSGKLYPNRKDMRTKQAPQAATGQTYGERGQQLASQQAIPLSRQPAPTGLPNGTAALASRVGGGVPGMVPSLDAPSTRPNEPLTAGLPTGPGPGPEALNIPPQAGEDDQMLGVLRGLYQAYPNSNLARLIAEMNSGSS